LRTKGEKEESNTKITSYFVMQKISELKYISYSKLWTILSYGHPLVPRCPGKKEFPLYREYTGGKHYQ